MEARNHHHTPEGLRRAAERLANRVRNRPVLARPGTSGGGKNGIQMSSRPTASPNPRRRGRPQLLLTRLLQLPPELQQLILSCLDFGDIERLRRTCHFFRNGIDKAMMRRLFPNLREELLSTCYLCLKRQPNKGLLVRGEETDARFPLASRCFDCVAQRAGFMVGRKYMLDNSESVWVCRWCGYPVTIFPVVNQPQFHYNCFRNYNRTLLLYFLLGCAQWAIVLVGSALCWRYFKHSDMVLGPTIVNFILSLWAFGLSVLRGSAMRTYHWALVLEIIIAALWIPPAFVILGHLLSSSSEYPAKSTTATMVFVGANMLFRLLNIGGNLLLVFEWKMWRRNKPQTSYLHHLFNCFLLFLVFWTDPQSMEQEYPAVWWFKGRGVVRVNNPV